MSCMIGIFAGMDAAIIQAYWRQQHDICCENLRHYARRASSTELHHIRVAIKKIKTVLTILRDLHGVDREAYFAPYRNIFDHAGKIREASVVRDRLRTLSTDRKAIMRHTHHISLMNRKLKNEIPFFITEITVMSSAISAVISGYRYDLSGYCHQLYRQLKKKWHKAHADEDYHAIRKNIKILIYAIALLPAPERKEIAGKHQLKQMDKLQDLIGTWHDYTDISTLPFTDFKDHAEITASIHKDVKKLRKKMLRKGDKLWADLIIAPSSFCRLPTRYYL